MVNGFFLSVILCRIGVTLYLKNYFIRKGLKMKKYLISVLFAVAFLPFFGSCASTNYSLLESASPMAVLGVSGNTHVPYYSSEVRDDEFGEEDGLISNAVNAFFGKNNPEILTAADRVDFAEDAFRRLMMENAGVEVVDKKIVMNSPTFAGIGKNSVLAFTDVKIRGKGYKFMDDIGSKKARLIMAETGAKSLVFMSFTFKKMILGDGTNFKGDLAARGDMNILVYNDQGKKVIEDNFTVISANTTELYMTKYDKEAIVEMFPDVIEQLINKFIVKYL